MEVLYDMVIVTNYRDDKQIKRHRGKNSAEQDSSMLECDQVSIDDDLDGNSF